MVKLTRPLWLLLENVVASRKGLIFQRTNEDLASEGYLLLDVELNAADSGLPQDRQRAYFAALRLDINGTDPFKFK